MDRMGLGVVYHVAKLVGETTPDKEALESAHYLDEHFIQKGLLGVSSGEGFYRYPVPAFEQSGFILSWASNRTACVPANAKGEFQCSTAPSSRRRSGKASTKSTTTSGMS